MVNDIAIDYSTQKNNHFILAHRISSIPYEGNPRNLQKEGKIREKLPINTGERGGARTEEEAEP